MYYISDDGWFETSTTFRPSPMVGCASFGIRFPVLVPTDVVVRSWSPAHVDGYRRSKEDMLRALRKGCYTLVDDIHAAAINLPSFYEVISKEIVKNVDTVKGYGRIFTFAWVEPDEYEEYPVEKVKDTIKALEPQGYKVELHTTKFHNSNHLGRDLDEHPGNTVLIATITYVGIV